MDLNWFSMANVLVLSAVALLVSLSCVLLLTPFLRRLALRNNLVDRPDHRRIHRTPIPRLGGVSIFTGFFLSFGLIMLSGVLPEPVFQLSRQTLGFMLGAAMVFGVGVWDDLRGVRPVIKLAVQVAAALAAYWGGIEISLMGHESIVKYSLGVLSLPITVLWYLLLINGFNLIDGLDGLAAGIAFLVSVILFTLCLGNERYYLLPVFAALAGSSLGFLRYNFNPASIFMGDSGSYFLGYCLASFSILGSIKGQATVAIIIPLIAMGQPVIEIFFTALRRFLVGHGIFDPDKEHFHHRLLKKGLSHRNTVLVFYIMTVIMGLAALVMVNAHSLVSGSILLILGIAAFAAVRKLGYLEYVAMDKLMGWMRDVTDEMGLVRDRRTFLGRQMAITSSGNLDELTTSIAQACDHLGVDYLEISLNGNLNLRHTHTSQDRDLDSLDHEQNLSVRVPLSTASANYGNLSIVICLECKPIHPYTLRRIEQLRRAVITCLEKLDKGLPGSEIPKT
jgi:UDP-GlcNAc:undecaprenyl-phosphate GlcNAc-1-phosphate transferase